MEPLISPRIPDDPRLRGIGHDLMGASFWEGVEATAEETWRRSPGPSLLSLLELEAEAPTPGEQRGLYGFSMVGQIAKGEPSRMLTEDEWRGSEHFREGLSFPGGVREEVARIVSERHDEETRRRDVLTRAPSGILPGAGYLATSLLTGLADPLNVASAFVPLVREARMAGWIARMGTTTARAARGVVEGAAGAAMVEPLVYGAAKKEQADYTMSDSLVAIGLGGVFGGGLHVGAGALGDMVGRMRERTREGALRSAVAQLAEGRPVDVEPILRADPDAGLEFHRRGPWAGAEHGFPFRSVDDVHVGGAVFDPITKKTATVTRKYKFSVQLEDETGSRWTADVRTLRVTEPGTAPAEIASDVLTFIRKEGGIWPGDEAAGEVERFSPKETGTTGLMNRNGHSPDGMRERLEEAGFLPRDSTLTDLWNLMDTELDRVTKGHAQRSESGPTLLEMEEADAWRAEGDRLRRAKVEGLTGRELRAGEAVVPRDLGDVYTVVEAGPRGATLRAADGKTLKVGPDERVSLHRLVPVEYADPESLAALRNDLERMRSKGADAAMREETGLDFDASRETDEFLRDLPDSPELRHAEASTAALTDDVVKLYQQGAIDEADMLALREADAVVEQANDHARGILAAVNCLVRG